MFAGSYAQQPRRINQDVRNGRALALVVEQRACVERLRPEPSMRWSARCAIRTDAHAQQENRQLVQRPRERHLVDVPLPERGPHRVSECLEAVDADSGVVDPEAQRERARGWRRCRQNVVEIAESRFGLEQQRAHEPVGIVGRHLHEGLPEDRGRLAAWNDQAPVAHMNAVGECGEGGCALVEEREQRRTTRVIRQRVVVGSGQAAAEQRGASVDQNRSEELVGGNLPFEYRVAPERRGEGKFDSAAAPRHCPPLAPQFPDQRATGDPEVASRHA